MPLFFPYSLWFLQIIGLKIILHLNTFSHCNFLWSKLDWFRQLVSLNGLKAFHLINQWFYAMKICQLLFLTVQQQACFHAWFIVYWWIILLDRSDRDKYLLLQYISLFWWSFCLGCYVLQTHTNSAIQNGGKIVPIQLFH